jgi:NADH-quinone oxidoreductase subunit G
LSIAGNCRICLVELKTLLNPLYLATNAKSALYNNMYHDSALIKKGQRKHFRVFTFKPPAGLPICDQGGDCDLQDQSLFLDLQKEILQI